MRRVVRFRFRRYVEREGDPVSEEEMGRGAGGTSGGVGSFFVGLTLFGWGLYLFLENVAVESQFSMSQSIWSFQGLHISGGMILVPFFLSVAMLFYDGRSLFGWLLFSFSLGSLVFGILSSIGFRMRPMSSFDLVFMLALAGSGLGIFVRSLMPLGHRGGGTDSTGG
jgi:hypothetical protein